jgi:hypothetical protein
MFCTQCGTNNDPNSAHCIQCGAPLQQAGGSMAPAPPPPPNQYSNSITVPVMDIPNYMVQSVLVTLFCCLPLGIVSIIKANKISRLLQAGDRVGAEQESKSNKTLLWVSFGAGLVLIVISFVVNVVNKN